MNHVFNTHDVVTSRARTFKTKLSSRAKRKQTQSLIIIISKYQHPTGISHLDHL